MSIELIADGRAAPKCDWFPTPALAVVWRNWGMVPAADLAAALETCEGEVRATAELMGLDGNADADPIWRTRGYLTVIRNNWNLCEFDQLLTLLGVDEARLKFILQEDDFMWVKMGRLKYRVERPRLLPLTPGQKDAARRIAEMFKETAATPENAFEFLRQYNAAPVQNPTAQQERLMLCYSYFAVYGDPLSDDTLDPYPDALLAKYAECGINGVWLQGILYQLTENPWEPALSEGWQRRIAGLRRLVGRAKKFGVGVYLYFNEPRPMDDAFFEKHPRLRGSAYLGNTCLCTSLPEVGDYLEDAVYKVFSAVPGLAGYFCITASENHTNCASHGPEARQKCPRCAGRAPEAVIAEVNNRMALGMRRAAPDARAISFTWAWETIDRTPKDNACVALLNQNQTVMDVSEGRKAFARGGVENEVVDYSVSVVGPGEMARRHWAAARENGLSVMAKIQLNCSWELSAVPFIPVFSLFGEHLENLKAEGIRDLMITWTVGGSDSPAVKLAHEILQSGKPAGEVTERFIRAYYGKAAQAVMRAQKAFSAAFQNFPFDIRVLYKGPQNYGPAAPFFKKPTGCASTMLGFPYDDLDGWRGKYPREVFLKLLEALVAGWEKGLEPLLSFRGGNAAFSEFYDMAEACYCHFASCRNQAAFVMSRDQGDDVQAMRVVEDEWEIALRAIAVRSRDSRIGFEASNHYYYTVQDLKEKLINLSGCCEYLKRKAAAKRPRL